MIERKKCLICCGDVLELFNTIEHMPVYMGTVDKVSDSKFLEMQFTECLSCGNVQIKSIPEIEDLYLKNHNIDLVGDLWQSHYEEFKNFIGDISNKSVLEISDPSAKLAKRCKDFKKWTIIEVNPHFESSDKIEVLREYFSYKTKITFDVDIIVHSHFFEHSLNPNQDLKKMFDILPNDGEMFFSVPDLESLIKIHSSPTALNFEHTFYYDISSMTDLLNSNGFEVINMSMFKNHSIFFHVKKNIDLVDKVNYVYKSKRKIFTDIYQFHKNNIDTINKSLNLDECVFIYGSHVTSQYYLFNGLKLNIFGILDKSSDKNNQFLYGTYLKTFFVEKIQNFNKCSVIVSHSSVYKDEIIKNINLIKGNTIVNFL